MHRSKETSLLDLTFFCLNPLAGKIYNDFNLEQGKSQKNRPIVKIPIYDDVIFTNLASGVLMNERISTTLSSALICGWQSYYSLQYIEHQSCSISPTCYMHVRSPLHRYSFAVYAMVYFNRMHRIRFFAFQMRDHRERGIPVIFIT